MSNTTASDASGDAAATPSLEEGEAFGAVLRNIGLTSLVTRAVAGELYFQELARQLCEFLRCGFTSSAWQVSLSPSPLANGFAAGLSWNAVVV